MLHCQAPMDPTSLEFLLFHDTEFLYSRNDLSRLFYGIDRFLIPLRGAFGQSEDSEFVCDHNIQGRKRLLVLCDAFGGKVVVNVIAVAEYGLYGTWIIFLKPNVPLNGVMFLHQSGFPDVEPHSSCPQRQG